MTWVGSGVEVGRCAVEMGRCAVRRFVWSCQTMVWLEPVVKSGADAWECHVALDKW
jgi:hypothetical protein